MTKYRSSALVASISFITLFSLSLFLYSCGVSSPTGSSSSGNPATQSTPSLPAPILLTASSTYNTISISMTGTPGKNHHLYMTDNPQAQASTSTPLPDNNIHNLTLDPSKTYYFILGEIGSDGKEHFSGAYITSKPPIGNNARENIVVNPPANETETKQIGGKNNTTTKNNSNINGMFGLNPYLKLTGGSRVTVWYDDMATGSVIDNLHISEPSGGHFLRGLYGENILGKTGGHPEVLQCKDDQGNPIANCWYWAYRWWERSSPVVGEWDYDDDKYVNRHAQGVFRVSLVYRAYPEPFHSFYGKPFFIYRVNVCGETAAEGVIPLKAGVDQNGTDYITPEIQINAPGSCPGDGTPPPPQNKKLAKIDITPDKLTTIYIHPKKPDAGKPDHGSQQYTAMGTFEGESVPVDVTKTGDVIWHSSKPDIATMSTKTGEEGLFIPVITPKITLDTTDIQATSVIPPATSNIAKLCVECWEYTHIRQNIHVPSTEMPDWVNEPYAMNWHVPVYLIYNGQLVFTKNKTTGLLEPVILYYVDQPRTAADAAAGYSIGEKGCHLVSTTMILTATTGQFVNPKTLNTWLTNHIPVGYDTGNGPQWWIVKQYTDSALGITNSNILNSWEHQFEIIDPDTKQITWTKEQSYAIINGALDNCNMVVLHVRHNNGKNFPSHYVVAVKKENGDYKIYDPWYFGGKEQQMDNLTDRYNIIGFNIIRVVK